MTGPYFFGDEPGVVDFAFAPFALRIEMLLSHYKGFRVPRSGEGWPRYHDWLQAMKPHPSFIATMPQPETYEARLIEFYLPYNLGGGQKDVTKAASISSGYCAAGTGAIKFSGGTHVSG